MRNEEIKELLELHTKAIKAEVKATTDILGFKLDEVIAHQVVTNGRVTKLEDSCSVFDRHVKNTNSFKKNWLFIACVALVLMFVTSMGSHWVIQKVDAEKTIIDKLGITIKEDEKG